MLRFPKLGVRIFSGPSPVRFGFSTKSSAGNNVGNEGLEKSDTSKKNDKNTKYSPRMAEFQKKLREKTPIGKLDEPIGKHPYEEKEPLKPWPDGVNPNTGERNGPAGPEPTRYGDWERKGRVSDF